MDHKDLIRAAECCDLKDCEVCPSKGRVCCRERTMQELAAALKNEILRAEAAEARALALETTHSTEMCEDGWDCAALGRARKAQEAAEARAEKAEIKLFYASECAAALCLVLKAFDGKMKMETVIPMARRCFAKYEERFPPAKILLGGKKEE